MYPGEAETRVISMRQPYAAMSIPHWYHIDVIHQFHQKLIDKQTEYEPIIPDFLFAEPKKFILVAIPFCTGNENTLKDF